ncbi:hypothetical protein CANARDRAFT_29402 [[Candida] arabinofermentans NRRL YB-2248]|uniref:E3 ubiquitin-protein ligase PEP5 n=1 Tax=[Candida] arabinofermentans NRRL YB-2248 TaxID=983967 RepID=A0A1E4SXM1_9ASCO|nr:hypothetical protein CANARDRAFT_29402 [[Candida] arabinofermentans NRRL YB-2248]
MSLSSWRQFPFFECIPIRDPNYGSEDALYSDSSISAICSSPEYFIIATGQSTIKLIDDSYRLVYEFTAYEVGWSITKLKYMDLGDNEGYLCSIAEKQGRPLSFKLWTLKKLMSLKTVDSNLDFHAQCQVSNGLNNYPLTCFSSSVDFSILAFGFANGTVILVRGDLLHDRGSRQRIVYESKEPITGVQFKDDSLLYVSTVSKILTIPTTGRNQGKADRILEDKAGVDINCSDVLMDNKKSLVVAKDESLQFYNSKGRSLNLLLNVPKKRLHAYGDRYILIVSSVTSNLTSSTSFLTNKLIIVNVVDKFIAFNQTISNSVIEVFEMWEDLYVLTSDGLLYKLHEKSLKEKLDIVVQRELFPIAIKLAETSIRGKDITTSETNGGVRHSSSPKNDNVGENQILEIKKQYGDYLYNKEEFEEAIKQYIGAIPLGKTSEIIQKYKESSKIQLLTIYLEELIRLGDSNEDHVTLLLCSYCKLKQPEEISSFIEDIQINEDFEVVEKHKAFDLETVINLCRESTYYKLASMIAKKFNRPSIVVDIHLKDLKSPKLTMSYIKTLNIDDLLRALIDNVKQLLTELPNECTQLLIEVFTGKFKPDQNFNIDSTAQTSDQTHSDKQAGTDYPILTSYRQFVSFMNLSEAESQPTEPTYLPPRPRIIFHSFVEHPHEFVIFLEACIESYDRFGGNEKDKKDIMVTLYEMYLTLSNENGPSTTNSDENRQQWQAKAKSLLEDIQKNWNLEDQTNLLLLSNLGDFNEGEILIRESTDDSSEGFELDMFRSSILSKNYDRSLEILNKYGKKEPELYKLALSTYTQSEELFSRIGEEQILKIINKIESLKLMNPLELVKQLSLANFIKIGLIKTYLISHIRKQKQEISNNEKLINSYKSESETLVKALTKLKTESQVINQSKCSSCQQPLEFPIIHFKCSHSFHEHCLTIDSNSGAGAIATVGDLTNGTSSMYATCPKCMADIDTLTVLKRQHEEIGERNDLFKASLVDNNDRFKVMMGFFGRGAMEHTRHVLQ